MSNGTVKRWFDEKGFGFIESADGLAHEAGASRLELCIARAAAAALENGEANK